MKACAIDVHHHYVPESLLEEAKKRGQHLGVTLTEKDGITTLTAAFGVPPDMEDYFTAAYPKALERVKVLAEGDSA